MSTPLDAATLGAYLTVVATVVAVLISRFIKPALERIPALSPTAPDQTLHDAALRAVNVALTVIGVLVMAAYQGQLTLSNWLPMLLQVALTAIGAHSVYQLVRPSQSAPMTATAAPAPSVTSSPSAPPAQPVVSIPPADAPIAAIAVSPPLVAAS